MVCSDTRILELQANSSIGNFKLIGTDNNDCEASNNSMAIHTDRKTTAQGGIRTSGSSILYLHALPMGVVFIILFPSGALCIRRSFLLHVSIQSIAAGVSLLGSAQGVLRVIAEPSKVRLSENQIIFSA
jgi:hypothetical protein